MMISYDFYGEAMLQKLFEWWRPKVPRFPLGICEITTAHAVEMVDSLIHRQFAAYFHGKHKETVNICEP